MSIVNGLPATCYPLYLSAVLSFSVHTVSNDNLCKQLVGTHLKLKIYVRSIQISSITNKAKKISKQPNLEPCVTQS